MAPKTTAAEGTEPKTLGDVLDNMPPSAARNNPGPGPINIPTVWATPLRTGIYAAISMITAEMGEQGIAKERETSGGGSKFKFRGIDQVYAALNPLLVKHGLIVVPHYRNRVLQERKTGSGGSLWDVVVEADFDFICVTDGSKVTVSTIGEAFDSGDKATNKAMSIAYKYAMFLTFCIPVEGTDDDPDATTHEGTTSPKQQQAPQQPQETEEERKARLEKVARNAYNDAEAWMRACTTMADLKRTFEEKIRWDLIPKGWHPRLVNTEKEMIEEIKKAGAPKPQTTAPDFGDMSDDIPF